MILHRKLVIKFLLSFLYFRLVMVNEIRHVAGLLRLERERERESNGVDYPSTMEDCLLYNPPTGILDHRLEPDIEGTHYNTYSVNNI